MPMSFERQLDVFEKWLRGRERRVPYYTDDYLYERANFFRLKVATAWGKEISCEDLVTGIRSRMTTRSVQSRKRNALARKEKQKRQQEELLLDLREPEFKLL